MSDHKSALVPLEAWCYSSPDVRDAGASVDIGLFAEALIYYDQIFLDIGNPDHFVQFLGWFVKQGKIADLLALLKDGTITIYDYSFITTAVHNSEKDTYTLLNIQDPIQKEPNTYGRRFLYYTGLSKVLPHARQRAQLYKAFQDRVIEVKADQFGKPPIDEAMRDLGDPYRASLIVQCFLDELYSQKSLGRPPQVVASVTQKGDSQKLSWNVDFDEIARISGKKLNFHRGTPLVAAALGKSLLWSASRLNCDLFLGSPISMVAGDKLYEGSTRANKLSSILDQLVAEVEFPDIRKVVNANKVGFDEVLGIRKKAMRFRRWLQDESARDRNALIAYHNEVGKELGIITSGRRALHLFGVLGAPALGSVIGTMLLDPPYGAPIGASAGRAIGYLSELASKIKSGWKPVVFGKWIKGRVEKLQSK